MRFMERSRLTIEAITALCKREFSVCVNATALKSSDTKPTTRRVVVVYEMQTTIFTFYIWIVLTLVQQNSDYTNV